ncbi:MAG: hypothetical protein R6V56_00350 [Lentisphaeria bacterium]
MGQNIQLVFNAYLLFMFVGFIILAVANAVRTSRASRWQVSEELLCQCSDCSLTFIVSGRQRVINCPRCGRQCRLRSHA